METITFYSYKGGVGRTLALSNTAIYLSRFGLNVCMLDFDLEAPGLHHKFSHLMSTEEIDLGIVDFIYEFTHKGKFPVSLKDYSYELVKEDKQSEKGSVTLIPAGKVSKLGYWEKLHRINWQNFLYSNDSEGILFFLELKERIKKEINPDFLLIDSRTGVTEIGGVSTTLMPDKVVLFIINNNENIEGITQIYNSIHNAVRLPNQKPISTFFCVTRVPKVPIDSLKREGILLKKILEKLNKNLNHVPTIKVDKNITILHIDRNLEVEETITVNNLDRKDQKETTLLKDYLKLFSEIIPENFIIPKLDTVINNILSNMLNEPDKTQNELESLVVSYPHYITFEKLIEFYILRNIEKGKLFDAFHKLWDIKNNFPPKLYDKYIELFIEYDLNRIKNNNLKIINIVTKYLDMHPKNVIMREPLAIYTKLIDLLIKFNRIADVGKYMNHALKIAVEKTELLEKYLYFLIHQKEYAVALDLLNQFNEEVDNSMLLKFHKVKILFQLNNVVELEKLIMKDEELFNYLLEKDIKYAFQISKILNMDNQFYSLIGLRIDQALRLGKEDEIYEIGKYFYESNQIERFRKYLRHTRKGELIIRDLDLLFRKNPDV